MAEESKLPEELHNDIVHLIRQCVVDAYQTTMAWMKMADEALNKKYGEQWFNVDLETLKEDKDAMRYEFARLYFEYIDDLIEKNKCRLSDRFSDYLPTGHYADLWYKYIDKKTKKGANNGRAKQPKK